MTGPARRFPDLRRDERGVAIGKHPATRFRGFPLPEEIFSRPGVWQEWRDSNPRPSVLETDALPTELHSCRRERLYRPRVCLASNEVVGRANACPRAET